MNPCAFLVGLTKRCFERPLLERELDDDLVGMADIGRTRGRGSIRAPIAVAIRPGVKLKRPIEGSDVPGWRPSTSIVPANEGDSPRLLW